MAGTVIERFGTSTDDGFVSHDDRPSTWEAAESIAGKRLDRRRNYAIINGALCESAEWTDRCSGCSGEYHESVGYGCHECGYTGKRRMAMWVPYGISDED